MNSWRVLYCNGLTSCDNSTNFQRGTSKLTRGSFWYLSPELRCNEENKHQNNTRVSTKTVRHESTYIILFFSRHKESINYDKTTVFTYRPCISLARFSFYRWRHNPLLMTPQWPINCDAITWIVISNSLDIDFIHGDIHGRSCKNIGYPMFGESCRSAAPNCKKWNFICSSTQDTFL